MTPQETKELAVWCTEFFGAEIDPDYGMGTDHWSFPVRWKNKEVGLAWHWTSGVINIDEWQNALFHDGRIAPILAHLAKREMEKLGFGWILETGNNRKIILAYIYRDRPNQWMARNENEYIALWLAIREAVKDD